MGIWLSNLLEWLGPRRHIASGSFTTNNTSAVTTSNLYGIASIARTGVGVFLVTLQSGAKEFMPILSLEGAAAKATNQAIVSAKSLTGPTITITVTDNAGTAADTTALTINVMVVARPGN